jgi:hypothetical protein
MRDGAVLYSARDDVEIARAKIDVVVSELNREIAAEDEEEVIGIGMGVPDELAFDLDQHDIVTVELLDDPGRPEIGEGLELLLEVDDWHDSLGRVRQIGCSLRR